MLHNPQIIGIFAAMVEEKSVIWGLKEIPSWLKSNPGLFLIFTMFYLKSTRLFLVAAGFVFKSLAEAGS